MAEGICTIEGCDRLRRKRGWCYTHYTRWWRHGDPTIVLPSPGNPNGNPRQSDYAALFEARVDRTSDPNGCHEWTGYRDRDGYGQFNHDKGRPVRAHRWAMEQHLGRPLIADELVCHTCDNPPCVRIDHLFVGTITDNNRDKIRKGRHPSRYKRRR